MSWNASLLIPCRRHIGGPSFDVVGLPEGIRPLIAKRLEALTSEVQHGLAVARVVG
jgi:hypothetical protein